MSAPFHKHMSKLNRTPMTFSVYCSLFYDYNEVLVYNLV